MDRVTWGFLERYCFLSSGVSAGQALVDAVSERADIQGVILSWERPVSTGHWSPESIIWNRKRLPDVVSGDALEVPPSAEHIAGPDRGRRVDLWVWTESEQSKLERRDKDELRRLVEAVATTTHQSATDSEPDPAHLLKLPLGFSDDLGYLQRHLDSRYKRFRHFSAQLLSIPWVSNDYYTFFLLYDSTKGALVYPVAGFYRLTDAGEARLQRHLNHIGGSWEALARRDVTTARRLLVDLFVEALGSIEAAGATGAHTTFSSSTDGTELLAAADRGHHEENARFCDYIRRCVLIDDGEDAPLARWQKRDLQGDGVRAAAELLQEVLRALPQGLSAGFATRCLRTGTSFLFQNSKARRDWLNPRVVWVERLSYELIAAVERHFFWGGLADQAGPHREHLTDSGDTIVAISPMMARGQPIGMFFVLERLTEPTSEHLGRVGPAALRYCERNAPAAAELVQRARENWFVQKCRTAIAARELDTDPLGALREVVIPSLDTFVNVASLSWRVEGEAEEPSRLYREQQPCQLFAKSFDGEFTLPRVHVSLPPLRIGKRTVYLKGEFECLGELVSEHAYEWVSAISAAYSHRETREAGARSAYAVGPGVVRHLRAKNIYYEWARDIEDVASGASGSSGRSREAEILRAVAWNITKHGDRSDGTHPLSASRGLPEDLVQLPSDLEAAVGAALRILAVDTESTHADVERGTRWLREAKGLRECPSISFSGCPRCFQYAIVEALLNAYNAANLCRKKGSIPPEPSPIEVRLLAAQRSLSVCVRNWHDFDPSGPDVEKLRGVAEFLSANPVPRTLGDPFENWMTSYASAIRRSPDAPGGLADDVARFIALQDGALRFIVGTETVELSMSIPITATG